MLSIPHVPLGFSLFLLFLGQGQRRWPLTSGLHPDEAVLHDVDAPDAVLAPVEEKGGCSSPSPAVGRRWPREVG